MPLFAKMPWDMVVFLTITTVGFGVSIKKLAYPGGLRSVAAVELATNSGPTSNTRSGILTLEMGCLERSAGLRNNNVSQGAVRLKGRFCDLPKNESKDALASVRIKNLETGSEGMIFISGNDAFVTDGMVLKPGKNTFTMQWKNNKSEKELRAEVYSRE